MDGMPHHHADAPQLRTLLLTDLCDSTGMVERLGDGAAAQLFRDHDRLVLELQQRWRGRLIDRSDGLLLLFERPLDGLGFALDYRRGLEALGQAHHIAPPLMARAGLHVGEVLVWRNSEEAVNAGAKPVEVEGLAKPFAARLMHLARPGQILLSSVAEPLVRRAARELGERGDALQWRPHGRWHFKGLPDVQEVHEVGEPGLAPLRMPYGDAKARRDLPLWRRPAALAAEAMLVAGVGLGIWFMTRPDPAIAFSERDWVVVGDLRNLTGQTVLDDSLEQAFRISLEQSRYVNVLSDLKVRDTLARMERDPEKTPLDRAVGSEVAQRDGARLLILPVVAEVGGRVRFSAEVVDPRTRRTLAVESADGSGLQSMLASIDEVTAALRDTVGETLASIQRNSAPLPDVTTSNLDALRAYALGQQAFARSQFRLARDMYARAVELDPRFALAHLGLVRANRAEVDMAAALPHLEKARQLRAHLPPRDQLYLDAWLAEVHAPREVPDRWRQMALLYPDYFPASANVGYALFSRNAYSEALDYATRAASSKNEFSALSWQLVGLLKLGLEDTAGAEQAFRTSLDGGAQSARVGLAVSQAALRRFDEAGRSWPVDPAQADRRFERISMLVDQGLWPEAEKQAAAIRTAVGVDSTLGRVALLPIAVTAWTNGRADKAVATLQSLVDQSLAIVEDRETTPADGMEAAYTSIVAALLAQRLGDAQTASRVVRVLERTGRYLGEPPVNGVFVALRAEQLRAAGKPDRAISLLEGALDGNEPIQLRVSLMEAYAAAGRREQALAQARWLAQSRGRAYAEIGAAWSLQPLNVYDSTLARLRAAELLAARGDREEAQAELRRFDSAWNPPSWPPQLRVRRDAVLATFN